MSNSKYHINPDYDCSRNATDSEIKKDYTIVQCHSANNNSPNSESGIVIGARTENGEVREQLVDNGENNTSIFGNPGSGKTRTFCAPSLLNIIMSKNSFIVHDSKKELLEFFDSLLDEMGYEKRILNFRNPREGDRINPLWLAALFWKKGEKGRSLEIAKSFAINLFSEIDSENEPCWVHFAIDLFLSYFCICADLYNAEDVTLGAIYRLHIEGKKKIGDHSTVFDSYLKNHENEKCYELAIDTITAPFDTRGSIYTVFGRGVSRILFNEDIEDMLSSSTFDVRELVEGEKPMALFIITRDEDSKTYSGIVSSIIDMIYTTLIDLAQEKYHNVLPEKVYFLLEEFGNIARLNNINDMMTASRSRQIRILLVLQSLSQLYMKYPTEEANIIIDNMQNIVYINSSDQRVLKMISEKCGETVDAYTNQKKPLYSTDKLRHFDKSRGQALMLLDRHYPYLTELPDISSYKVVKPREVLLPERKPYPKQYIDFKKIVEKEIKEKLKSLFLNENINEDKKRKEEEKTLKQMLSICPKHKSAIDRIIENNR